MLIKKGMATPMEKTSNRHPSEAKPPVVREYHIGDTKYIVTATIKDGASEDATAKVRRLIRNEIRNGNCGTA
jgi:hypothetical protein